LTSKQIDGNQPIGINVSKSTFSFSLLVFLSAQTDGLFYLDSNFSGLHPMTTWNVSRKNNKSIQNNVKKKQDGKVSL